MAENYQRNRCGYSGNRYAAVKHGHGTWRFDGGIYCGFGVADFGVCGRDGTRIYQTETGRGNCGGKAKGDEVRMQEKEGAGEI